MKISLILIPFSSSLTFVQAKGLWASTPASFGNVIKEAYPVGNGRLAGMCDEPSSSDAPLTCNSFAIWTPWSRESSLEYRLIVVWWPI
jgi:hypothetical protein